MDYEKEYELRLSVIKRFVKLGLILFIGLIVVFGSFTVVGAGQRGVVIRLGNVSRVLDSGLSFKFPIIEHVEKIDVQTQKEEVDATAASKDLQNVNAKVALNYNVNPEQVSTLWREIGEDYKSRVIDPAIQEAIKASTANYTAEELITKREQLRGDILNLAKEKLANKHIFSSDVSIVNFKFSPEFENAIEAKVTAEQDALAAKNKLEQVKYEADQRVTQAKGEAEAIRIQAQAITQQGGAEYVRLKTVDKWNGILPNYMLGESVPFIDLK